MTRRTQRSLRASQRGFSLIELAVVVMIIGILAAMAMPAMGDAQRERHVYDDAGSILELVRTARTRAMGRGSAVMVTFDTVTSGNTRGNYRMYEAVAPNPGTSDAGANANTARLPSASCTYPATAWDPQSTGTNAFIDGVTLNGTYENTANIMSRIVTFDNTGTPTVVSSNTVIALCFTPVGRTYYWAGNGSVPQFSAAAPFLGTIAIDVVRLQVGQSAISTSGTIGITRRVLVPSSGNARMVSTLNLPAP